MRKTGIGFLAILGILVALLGLMSRPAVAQVQTGVGWSAEYYSTPNFSGTPFTATLPGGVTYAYGLGSPDTRIPADNFSSRFTSVQNLAAGTYRFSVTSDDDASVSIDGTRRYDRGATGTQLTESFTVDLTAGQHVFVVEHVELVSEATIIFQWELVGGQVFTPSFGTPGFGTPGFFPTPFGTPPATVGPTPTPTRIPNTPLPAIPPGALTGTVVRATVLLVRTGPFFGAPVASRILRGQTYQVIGRDPDARWFLLQLSQGTGWVWGYYLFVNGNEFNAPVQNAFVPLGGAAASTGVVGQTNAVLRLRAEPNAGSAQTGRIPWGDLLPILARTNTGWYQVVFRGTVGWVSSEFVNIVEGDINVVPVQ